MGDMGLKASPIFESRWTLFCLININRVVTIYNVLIYMFDGHAAWSMVGACSRERGS